MNWWWISYFCVFSRFLFRISEHRRLPIDAHKENLQNLHGRFPWKMWNEPGPFWCVSTGVSVPPGFATPWYPSFVHMSINWEIKIEFMADFGCMGVCSSSAKKARTLTNSLKMKTFSNYNFEQMTLTKNFETNWKTFLSEYRKCNRQK